MAQDLEGLSSCLRQPWPANLNLLNLRVQRVDLLACNLVAYAENDLFRHRSPR